MKKAENKNKKTVITVAIILALLFIGGGTAAVILTGSTQADAAAAPKTVTIADTAAPLAAPDTIIDSSAATTDAAADLPVSDVPDTEPEEPEATAKPVRKTQPLIDQVIVPVVPVVPADNGNSEDKPTTEELEAARLEALTKSSIQWLNEQLSDNTSLVYKYFVGGNRLNSALDSNGVNYGVNISAELRNEVAGHDVSSVFAWLMVSHNSTNSVANNTYDIYWTNEDLSQLADGETIDDVTKYETETDGYTDGIAQKDTKQMVGAGSDGFDVIDPESFVEVATSTGI